jgi:hypothetical protein
MIRATRTPVEIPQPPPRLILGSTSELRRRPTAIESLMDLAREGSGRHALDVWASA